MYVLIGTSSSPPPYRTTLEEALAAAESAVGNSLAEDPRVYVVPATMVVEVP
ncbi:MAG TPA: hypothetical protein VHA75_00045 [Rugosimonospora sp.]|nr:hypothetical protein [Rugosimonospora sp.]